MSLEHIAIKTLISDRGKLIMAVVGVAFSVVLVNVQIGLFLGLMRKAGMLVDHSQADIWVGHKLMHNVDFARDIPRRWMHRIKAVPQVERVEPMLIGFSEMTLPSGSFESVVVVGLEPQATMGRPWNLDSDDWRTVARANAVIVDAFDSDKLEAPQVGEIREIGQRRVRVADHSRGILGFLVTPYVFTTFSRAAQLLHRDPRFCSYFLVRIEPGADAKAVCQQIRERIADLDAYPAEEYSRISQRFWMLRTGIGISFGAATVLGLIVGLVMVGQTLQSMVLDRRAEFAALKAMGATHGQLFRLLAAQSTFLALLGGLVGLAGVSWIHYAFHTPRAPMEIPWWLSGGSLALVTLICWLAALVPYLHLRRIDPLLVLQGN
jgi:putative ABC transport system permease protein